MNPAFQEALAARMLWVDVVVLEQIEGSAAQVEAALQAAYDAVHELASKDVLTYRHYGPRAPLLLQDVPELADQYNLAHELYSELFYENYHNGSLGALSTKWLKPSKPLDLPYTKWLAAVDMNIAELMGIPCSQAAMATNGHSKTLLFCWSNGREPKSTAEDVVDCYEMDQKEERRQYVIDIADTYASIDADLVEGWREECQDLGLID